MIKRLVAQLLLVSSLALLVGCSSHQPSTNSRTTQTVSAASNGSSPPAISPGFSRLAGLVVNVVDGDTIDVLDEQHTKSRIRLQGIDAPEKRQAFGDVARRNLANLVAGKKVLVEWRKHDKYGRIIGKVFCGDEDVCLDQIRAGLAWFYKEYQKEQSEDDQRLYSDAEQAAQSQKIGLWHDSVPIQPWEFRHHKPTTADSPELEPPNHSAPPVVTTEAEGSIRGNKHSKIYHWPGCPNYDDIAPNNRVTFRTREEAEKAGYRAAKNCP